MTNSIHSDPSSRNVQLVSYWDIKRLIILNFLLKLSMDGGIVLDKLNKQNRVEKAICN